MRINAQTLQKSAKDENDHRLMEQLEKMVAKMYNGTVQSVQEYIEGGSPALPFSRRSPVASMLIIAFCLKSGRYTVFGDLAQGSSDKFWDQWRRSIHYRNHGELPRQTFEASITAVCDMKDDGEDVGLLFGPIDGADESHPKAAEKTRLYELWLARVKPSAFLAPSFVLSETLRVIEDRNLLALRGGEVVGGNWSTECFQRCMARALAACRIELSSVESKAIMRPRVALDLLRTTEIGKRFTHTESREACPNTDSILRREWSS